LSRRLLAGDEGKMMKDMGESMQNRLKIFIVCVALMVSGFSGANAEPPQAQNNAIVVYYFHRTIRCPSCTLLEEVTREAVKFGFDRELKSGSVRMVTINIDKKDHEHFVDDYKLNVQSVIVSQVVHGKEKRWKNLDQVWTLLENEGHLLEYIQKEIKGYLQE
jgi:hypothetical protein